MSHYQFGNDYDLNYYPPEAYDGMGGVDWDKVERVEIESDVYVKERTCTMRQMSAFEQALSMVEFRSWCVCSNCGLISPCESRYCPNCGAKVVGE